MFISARKYCRDLQRLTRMVPDADCVVGISRGGLIPAIAISYAKDLPVAALHDHTLSWLCSQPGNINRVLLVDDLVDTGETLLNAIKTLQATGASYVVIAVLYFKETGVDPLVEPHIFVERIRTKWITFFYDSLNDTLSKTRREQW